MCAANGVAVCTLSILYPKMMDIKCVFFTHPGRVGSILVLCYQVMEQVGGHATVNDLVL